jgi:hypothetical protein
MAKIKEVWLSGSVGPIICYTRNGVPCSRTKPSKVRQNKSTKAAAKVFGIASGVSKVLRKGMETFLIKNGDSKSRYLVDNAVYQWLLAGKPIELMEWENRCNLQFNKKKDLGSRLKVQLTVDWSNPQQAVLKVPELSPGINISAPANTQVLHWMVTISGSGINHNLSTASYTVQIDTPYIEDAVIPAMQIPLECELGPDILTVVALSLKYSVKSKYGLTQPKTAPWTPAAIVAAHYEPAVKRKEVSTRRWKGLD